jgi:hypothetical protein
MVEGSFEQAEKLETFLISIDLLMIPETILELMSSAQLLVQLLWPHQQQHPHAAQYSPTAAAGLAPKRFGAREACCDVETCVCKCTFERNLTIRVSERGS